jgi:hypothetical protein
MEPNQKQERPIPRGAFIALAIFCVAAILYGFRGIIYNELNSLNLIPLPERFTELYFTNSTAIPTSTTPGRSVTFAFTVVNHQGVTTTYPYTSYFTDPSARRTILASGSVSLADGASITIPVSYSFTGASIAGEVIVDLPSLNDQSIDFHLPYAN